MFNYETISNDTKVNDCVTMTFMQLEMCRCDTAAPAGIAKLDYGTC